MQLSFAKKLWKHEIQQVGFNNATTTTPSQIAAQVPIMVENKQIYYKLHSVCVYMWLYRNSVHLCAYPRFYIT